MCFSWSFVYCVIILCVFLLPHVYCFTMCIAVSHTLVAGLLAGSQYPEGPATRHLDTGFSWFSCVYKQMLRWFPRLQVATACFSCSPPDLNFLDPYFIFMYMHNNHCHWSTAHLRLNILLYYYYYYNYVSNILCSSSGSLYYTCSLTWYVLHAFMPLF